MRISVIDIGTNTVLMLIADVERDGTLTPVFHGHEIARLGQGVDERGVILPETMERVSSVLGSYRKISDQHGAERILGCGTSALRDAANRDEFIGMVSSRHGFEVQVLDGNEEAELTYLGAVSEFPADSESPFAVLDIGGGSTEITMGKGRLVQKSVSLDIGCVRLTERYLQTSPPSSLGMSNTLRTIREQLKSLPEMSSAARLIGVAGTVTTLASMDIGLPDYDPLKVNGHELTLEFIQGVFNKLRIKTLEEMKAYPQIHPGRADVLLAGIVILMEVMKQINRQAITASDRGLRYGLALREGAS